MNSTHSRTVLYFVSAVCAAVSAGIVLYQVFPEAFFLEWMITLIAGVVLGLDLNCLLAYLEEGRHE